MSSNQNFKENSAGLNEKSRSGSSSNINEIKFLPSSNSTNDFNMRTFTQSGPATNYHHFRGSSVQPPARQSSYQYSSYQSGYDANYDNMNVNNYDFVASKQKFPSFNSLSFDSVNSYNKNNNYKGK